MMLQDLGGNTPEYLAEQAGKFIEAATARPEIANVGTLYRASVPQVSGATLSAPQKVECCASMP